MEVLGWHYLTSREALQLAADFARRAEYMRADDAADFQTQADLYETASRIAFLRAHMIAKNDRSASRRRLRLPTRRRRLR